MPKFLIDVNLPYHFSLWKGDNYIHQNDINDEWTDELNKEHKLVTVFMDRLEAIE